MGPDWTPTELGVFDEFTNACRALGAERDESQLDADPQGSGTTLEGGLAAPFFFGRVGRDPCPRTIQGFEAMLWLRKGFGFAGPWTVREQNRLLALCFSLPEVNKV